MKRKGNRGEGNWKRITWDEAYEEIVAMLQKRGNKEFMLETGPGAASGLSRWVYEQLGVSALIDSTGWKNANRSAAHELTLGEREGVYDVAASRYVLNFGANPFENDAAYIGLAQRIVQAKIENRAKLVTVDVRLSNTAGRSDEWLPINPAADGAVALAMAGVLLKRGLADREFLETWTNYPLEALEKYLEPYDIRRAEAISGINASDIERIAVEVATNKPATIISGGGVTSHGNGVYNERCILLLNAVAGTIDAPGGYCLPRIYPVEELIPARYQRKAGFEVCPDLGSFLDTGKEMGVYLSCGANPVYANPVGEHDLAAVFKDESLMPYVVAVDSHMSETALLADMVLPAATYLESWGLESRPSFERIPFLSLTQPVSEPVGESLPYDEICLQLSTRITNGKNPAASFSGIQEAVEAMVAQIEGLSKEGGLDRLKQRGVWIEAGKKATYRSYKQKGFNTPSGKCEIYSNRLAARGKNPLPVYEPLKEIAGLEEDEFVLIRYEVPVHTPLLTANAKWAQEIAHDNALWVNPEAAKRLRIKDGEVVTVTSEAGRVSCRAQLRQGIHPRVVALAAGAGHWGYGHIAQAKAFKSDDPDTALLWWEHAGNGINVNALIPLEVDPIGKGQAWMDTTVTISRA